jgi:hypothetical protein
MNKKKGLGILLATLLGGMVSHEAAAQRDSSNLLQRFFEAGNYPKNPLPALRHFSVGGYYRFLANYRQLSEAYSHLENAPRNIFIGDDSQIPQLMLNLAGSTSANTSFGTDLFLWSPMTGAGQIENIKGLNLGISLYGSHTTDLGTFTVRTGGINWYALSPFTFQTNRGYNRYTLFERNPWDPNTATMETRYRNFFEAGSMNQDARWGQQAFQGLILEATALPKGYSAVLMYGKTQLNGGLSPIPNNAAGGRVRKDFGKHFVSLNNFTMRAFMDSLSEVTTGISVLTSEFRFRWPTFMIQGEIGAGSSYTGEREEPWGEAISLKAEKTLRKNLSLEMHLYRIAPQVVNNSSTFINTSVQQPIIGGNNTATQPVLPAVASAMTPIGQLVNNRQGVDLNTQWNIGPLHAGLGWSMSAELERRSNQITYTHPVNSLQLAHFWRWDFPGNVGPYNNLSKIYRSVYETLPLANADPLNGLPMNDKYFNSLELHLRYNSKISGRNLYMNYLGQYSSAQYFLSPITVFSEAALLRTYYHQFEAYYALSPGIIWCNYLGWERIVANYETLTDAESRRPKNQHATAIATGFDIKLSKGSGLYLRQRWMQGRDASFSRDRYRGFETSAEIKIFF